VRQKVTSHGTGWRLRNVICPRHPPEDEGQQVVEVKNLAKNKEQHCKWMVENNYDIVKRKICDFLRRGVRGEGKRNPSKAYSPAGVPEVIEARRRGSVHVTHSTAMWRHGWHLFLLWLLTYSRLGGDNQPAYACGVLECNARHFGGIDHTRFD
jgi:hypothetical protein